MVGSPLRLVLCGTPSFAVPTFAALSDAGHAIPLVLTQPDRPQGRGMTMVAPPVKQWALSLGLPVEQPEKIRNNEELRRRLEAIAPDAIVVVAYGRILPPWMLALPRLGCINLHGSLLPKYRGAAPIQWAVANGERATGVTTMLLEEGMDTGPTLERLEVPIADADTAPMLFERLAVLGAPLVGSTLTGLAQGTLEPQPQDHAHATYAPMLTREEGRIDFSLTAQRIYDRWRGFTPWPGAWSTLGGRKFTLQQMRVASAQPVSPGTLHVADERLFVGCGDSTALELLAVQMEGKRAMTSAEFLRGNARLAGEQLG